MLNTIFITIIIYCIFIISHSQQGYYSCSILNSYKNDSYAIFCNETVDINPYAGLCSLHNESVDCCLLTNPPLFFSCSSEETLEGILCDVIPSITHLTRSSFICHPVVNSSRGLNCLIPPIKDIPPTPYPTPYPTRHATATQSFFTSFKPTNYKPPSYRPVNTISYTPTSPLTITMKPTIKPTIKQSLKPIIPTLKPTYIPTIKSNKTLLKSNKTITEPIILIKTINSSTNYLTLQAALIVVCVLVFVSVCSCFSYFVYIRDKKLMSEKTQKSLNINPISTNA